jgi:Brp/Blh family beta-carotene 15,15'-monooxygenase
MTNMELIAISAVLLIGVPHGGLDGAVARRIGWPKGLIAWFGFNLSYIFLAALVVWVWSHWPLLGLSVFLTISALHFGSSDIANTQATIAKKLSYRWLPLTAHGGLVPIAIPNLQPDSVQPLFTLLVGDVGADMLINAIGMLFLPWLVCFAAYFVYAVLIPVWRKPLLNLIIVLILVWFLSPLISFALYFCLWHSRSHTLRIWRSLDKGSERRRSLIEAVAYSLIAWITTLVIFMVFQESLTTALIKITFIGLAALTVPHMLLVDLADKLKRQSLWL